MKYARGRSARGEINFLLAVKKKAGVVGRKSAFFRKRGRHVIGREFLPILPIARKEEKKFSVKGSLRAKQRTSSKKARASRKNTFRGSVYWSSQDLPASVVLYM